MLVESLLAPRFEFEFGIHALTFISFFLLFLEESFLRDIIVECDSCDVGNVGGFIVVTKRNESLHVVQRTLLGRERPVESGMRERRDEMEGKGGQDGGWSVGWRLGGDGNEVEAWLAEAERRTGVL